MPITFACEACEKSFTVSDQMAGKVGFCKSCGAKIQVPAAAAEPDDYGLDLAGPAALEPKLTQPRTSVYTPAPDSREVDRSQKPKRKKSKNRSGVLMGPGGYNNDKIRFAIGAILVVGFIVFRIWLKSSLRR